MSGRPRESILCPAKSRLKVEINVKVRIENQSNAKSNITIEVKIHSAYREKIGYMRLKINIMQNYDYKRSPSKNSMTNGCSTSLCDVFIVSDKRFGIWQQIFLL